MIWTSVTQKDKILKKIYRLIRRNGEMTKSQLAEEIQIKSSTLNRAVDELLAAGLIKEKGHAISTGGRRPVLYELQPDAGFTIGIDISRTYCSIVLVNLVNDVLDETRLTMDTQHTPQQVIQWIIDSIRLFLEQHGITKDQLLGIGIGTVGPFDRENGRLLNPRHFPVPGWDQFSIQDCFVKEFNVPVLMENGANTAAWAEYRCGTLQAFRNIIYTHIGMGIRCGIISEGRLVQGNNLEDAFGHTVIDIDGNFCSCGNYGCLETYCSIPSLIQKVKNEIKKGRVSSLSNIHQNIDYLKWEDLVQGLQASDSLCEDVISESALYYGTGLVNLINTIHPEAVILGGPIIQHSDIFYVQTIKTAKMKTYRSPGYKVQFYKASLEERSIALGAAILVLDACLT